jgi:hypothetical protein
MGKYFKYAIGEIVLVVIGILIALQINNWNESRIKSNKEATVLVNIHKEFKNNKKQLDSVIKLHEQTYNACSKIISHFPIKSKPNQTVLDSLSVYLWNSYGGITFNPSQSSIDALTNTSSFDVIKNDQLRDLLISWNDLITDYQEEELSSKAYGSGKFDTFMSKYFDFNYNFHDPRNNFKALQTLEFEFLIKTQHDLVNQILHSSGELQKVQETLDSIIELSKPNRN